MLQRLDAPACTHMRPPLWNGRFVLGGFALTFSVSKSVRRAQQPGLILNRLAALRRERGLALGELANLLRIHPTTLAAMEDGSYLPSLRLAMELSEFFALPIEAIFHPTTTRRNIWPEHDALVPAEE